MERLKKAKEDIRLTIGNVLGNSPSKVFYTRVDRILDECADMPSLVRACSRLISIADLFISEDKAKEIKRNCNEILEKITA
ncbi:MAG: hypothetical protein WA666_13005 [Nitrospirota bacterium]